jgi:hypothetical protein
MRSIEEKAIETYQKNLKFLEENNPQTWKKLQLLELAIYEGTYKENYVLDYKESYFDVQELKSQNYLYNTNSTLLSQQLAKQVNYKKDSFIFDGFPLYYQYEQMQNQFDDKTQGLEDIYPLMSYYLENVHTTDEMKEIEKFIFIGVGLGMHIFEVDQKINAEEYFIIEDDLELFRLSLFTTPYYKLANKTLYFSIGDNKQDFIIKFQKFLENSFFKNKYLKYLHFSAHSQEKIKLIKNTLASQAFVSFPYKTNLDKYLRTLNYLNSGYNFLNLSKHFKSNQVTQKPLIILASGPSLNEQVLKWLQKNKHKFIILALSATLKTLYEHQIEPDIVTHLDGFKTSIKHFEGFEQQKFLKNSIAIVGGFTPSEVLQYFQKENIYIVEDHGTFYNKGFDAATGPCVGSTSIIWSTTMGFESIYLLGIDFAVSPTGDSHSQTHQVTQKCYDINEFDKLSQSISFRGDFFAVKGNFQKEVFTNPLFFTSIHALNTTLPALQVPTQKIYNLNNGAYIKHTIPKKIEELPLETLTPIKKQDLHSQLHKLLQNYSKKELSNDDIISLQKRLSFTKEIKEYIQNYQTAPLSKQVQSYLYNLISLALAILQSPTRENSNLVTLYDYYLSYTMPIIFDLFNTKQLKNEKKHIKKVDDILLKGMIKIEKIYEEALEKFLNKKI